MQKSLDHKLAAIHADPHGCREFILADAKDADMGFGIAAPGVSAQSPERHPQYKSLADYRQQIRQVIKQGVVDIVLMSASTSEQLTIRERLFDDSPVTPAARANDASDVHILRGGSVYQEAAKPFRTAGIDHMQCGRLDCEGTERRAGVDLGLYSVTLNNNRDLDLHTLEKYKQFREEAERKGFRHFLEVFAPNQPEAVAAERIPQFINDAIARTLAGVTSAGRPIFLKIPYLGPQAMEELVHFDPHLIVGVLGGSAGTTRDAFQLIHDAQKHGAKAALFGRKINNAEHQLAFIKILRLIVDGVIGPEDAVQAYHAVLAEFNIPPKRPLEDDLQVTETALSYGGNGSARTTAPVSTPARVSDRPAFDRMSPEERLAYHRDRLNRMFGEHDG